MSTLLVTEIKGRDIQTDGQQIDYLRVPFFSSEPYKALNFFKILKKNLFSKKLYSD